MKFTRRDFLKFASLLPLAGFARPLSKLRSGTGASADQPNVFVLLFDAWAARHVPLYGYGRNTMPNLVRFAQQATIYHNHYSAGTFTVPGTASLLSGMYPWTHRAFDLGAGMIQPRGRQQVFGAVADTRSVLAYAQNRFADLIIDQARDDLDVHLRTTSFDVERRILYDLSIFRNDPRIAYATMADNLFQSGSGYDSSLFLGPLERMWVLANRLEKNKNLGQDYPLGLPDSTQLFRIEDVVNGAIENFGKLQEPSFVYWHFYPPHGRYKPTKPFINKFYDGWDPVEKPQHPWAYDRYDRSITVSSCRYYDQYIASWDNEVARLFDFLKSSGLLDRSYVIITSDHGEMFERGEIGHWTQLIYDANIHVPLIIHAPGQTERKDVHAYTSSLDVMPTIARLTGNPIPDWAEGQLLPEFGGEVDSNRSIRARNRARSGTLMA